jgi:hypothetical protein
MKKLLLVALAGALFGVTGAGLAQQQSPAGAGAQPATCSEQAAFCKSGCPSSGRDRQCVLGCETNLAECKATGFWKSAGQRLPRRKE